MREELYYMNVEAPWFYNSYCFQSNLLKCKILCKIVSKAELMKLTLSKNMKEKFCNLCYLPLSTLRTCFDLNIIINIIYYFYVIIFKFSVGLFVSKKR